MTRRRSFVYGIVLLREVGAIMDDGADQEGVAALDSAQTSKRVLVISRRGPPESPFGWEIYDSGGEVARSSETFSARDESVADGQRALDESVNL